MTCTGSTRLAGVMGWPVSHSRSPRLHGYWLEKYGIDGAYLPLGVEEASFATALRGLAASGFRGVNVTVPHKQAAFALCDHVEGSAHRAGAVNTIVFGPDGLRGSNTDGVGFLKSLAAQGLEPSNVPAMVIGAGGAARAVAAALSDAGANVVVTARRDEAAADLAKTLGKIAPLPWNQRDQALGGFRLVVNTTTCGMSGYPPLLLSLDRAASNLVVADIVYTPRQTTLLADARARGLETVEGIGMLLHQAVPGFHAWFGLEPEVNDDLRAFMLAV